MTHETIVAEKSAVDIARANLKAAQDAFRKATARWTKLSDTIDATEDRLAKAQASLAAYGEHLDAEVSEASARCILQNRELKLADGLERKLADRERLERETKFLSDGLGSLKDSLKKSYAEKRAAYEALDAAGSEVIREEASLPLSHRLGELKEAQRQIVSQLRAFESASITRSKQGEFYINRRDFLGQTATQLLAQEPQKLDVNSVALARSIEQWHAAMMRGDHDAKAPEME